MAPDLPVAGAQDEEDSQMSLQSNNEEEEESNVEPYHGDIPGTKGWNIFRGCTNNLQNLPTRDDEEGKYKSFFDAMDRYQIDAAMLQEVGLNHNEVERDENKWRYQCDKNIGRGNYRTVTAHNKHDLTWTVRQWGGTAILTTGATVNFNGAGSGADSKGLGRWCWTRYRGRNNIILRVVSVYRPNKNLEDAGSAYKQQRRQLNQINDDEEVWKAFLQDLCLDMMSWLEKGDQLLVGGDLNQDIFSKEIQDLFEEFNMHHMVFCRHDPAGFPATCVANTKKVSIDGVWGTANLVPVRSGYLEAGDFPGDHTPIWFDITYQSAFGHAPPVPQTISARKLSLNNAISVERYQEEVIKQFDEANLFERQYKLERDVIWQGYMMTPTQAIEANRIDNLRKRAMLTAENKCRTLKMGAVDFSEAVETPKKKIKFWKRAVQRKKMVRKCSSGHWKRLK